jgi:hypothetical protein
MSLDDQRDNEEIESHEEIISDDTSWDRCSQAVAAVAVSTASLPTESAQNLSHVDTDIGDTCKPYPEVCNTGVPKYQVPELPTFPSTLRSGGYDGGTENAFFGRWDFTKWSEFVQIVEPGKRGALHQKRGMNEFVSLGGVDGIIIHPRGKSVGNNHYPYMLEWGGYDLKFWGDPESEPSNGHVRVCYRAEVTLEYGIDEAQRRLLDWLSILGFTLDHERLSNVDLNVCVPIPVSEFVRLIDAGHCVTQVQKNGAYKKYNEVETYFLGSRNRTQMRIYDKRVELIKCDFRKVCLTILRHIGDAWFNSDLPITRVEFSIGRDRLKGWDINSLAEFRAREHDIVDVLTGEWFRILKDPKVRGHENTAQLHPYWVAVRSEFLRCFDGSTVCLSKVQKTMSVDLPKFGAAVMGYLRKMVGYKYGDVKRLSEFKLLACDMVRELCTSEDIEKLHNFVVAFKAQKNCTLGESKGLEEFKEFDAE